MVTRIGHIALRVADLDGAIDFQREIIGMQVTERSENIAYLTCNERHHELILIEDPDDRGYDHIALEVTGPSALELARKRISQAGGELIGDVYDGEPGIDRALMIRSPGGHAFKLFCGMNLGERGRTNDVGGSEADRPLKFEHVGVKVRPSRRLERFLQDGLGFRLSDRMGPFASWWHCDTDHHGVGVQRSPRSALSHYAYAWPDLNAIGRVADRLAARGRSLIWGPRRHGPGNNQFIYFHDNDGAMVECCAELARVPPAGDHAPRHWPVRPATIDLWGGLPPLRFLLTEYPIASGKQTPTAGSARRG